MHCCQCVSHACGSVLVSLASQMACLHRCWNLALKQVVPCSLSWRSADAAHRRTDSTAPPRQQTWPGVEESSPSEEEWRKQAAPTYSAYPWNDAEVAELGKAGGLGMLGTKFHRKTTINW